VINVSHVRASPSSGQCAGVDAIAGADLADRLGEVVPDSAVGQVQLFRDLGRGVTLASQAKHLPLTIGQRIAVGPRFRRELRIDRPAARVNAADRLGKMLRGRVLEHVP
jgi:hypothetical protein